MKRSGFTAIETLMVIGVIAVTAGLAVPTWRNAQIRKDLQVASDQVKLALELAQSDARKGVEGSGWGVYASPSVGGVATYQGLSFTGVPLDVFPFPDTVHVSGLNDIAFLPVSGDPTSQGEIILTALNGDQIILTITPQGSLLLSDLVEGDNGGGGFAGYGIFGGESGDTGSVGIFGDTGTIQGDTGTTQGNTGTTQGDTGTTEGDTGTTEGDTGTIGDIGDIGDDTGMPPGGGCRSGSQPIPCDDPLCTAGPCEDPATCEDRFVVSGDDSVFTTGKVNVEMRAVGADITYGAGGPEVDVRVDVSTNNGLSWTSLFGGQDIDGGESEWLYNVAPGSKLALKFVAQYQSFYHKTRYSNDQTGFVQVLRTGDPVPNIPAFSNQTSIATYLQPYIQNGRIAIGQYDAIFLVELGTDSKTSSAFDLNDAVVLMRFEPTADSCSSVGGGITPPTVTGPRYKVVFNRVENTGNGNASDAVYVGPDQKRYANDQWIPLRASNGQNILDGGLVEDVAGLASERRQSVVRVLSHGSFANSNSKEVVDADVIFDGACIVGVDNDTAPNSSENPFDGIENDLPGGDEVTISPNRTQATFKTRVTTNDDAVLLQWKEGSDCSDVDTRKITICHIDSGKGTADLSYHTITVSENAWGAHENHGDVRGACEQQQEVQICHFTGNPSAPYETLAIFASQWSGYRELEDHIGPCTGDDDSDGVPNWKDICPNTALKESPERYLLWFRNAHRRDDTSIFLRGPQNSIGQYTLNDTSGCDCKDLLDIADRKPGSATYKTPELYFSLGTLPQFYIDTARKFGCTDSLVESVRRNIPLH